MTVSNLFSHTCRFEMGYIQRIDMPRCPFHHHFLTEIVYHVRGRGTTALDTGQKVAFEEGSVVVYPPGMVHNQICETPGGSDLVVHFEDYAEGGFQRSNECVYIPPPLRKDLIDLLFELGRADPANEAARNRELNLKLSYLLLELSGLRHEQNSAYIPDTRSAQVIRARDHIRRHYRTISSMRTMAKDLGFDYEVLRKDFKAEYGISLKKWHGEVRAKQAMVLLKNSVLPLREIAELSGFLDEQHFCAQFKKATGDTPGAFRKKFSGLASCSIMREKSGSAKN